MNAAHFSRLPIGSHRLPHDCKRSGSKPLKVEVTFTKNGVRWIYWRCFRCNETGDGPSDSTAGGHSGRAPARSREVRSTLSQYWRDLFAQCRPIAGAALEYLQARQCVIPPADSDLRYHPKLKHPCGHEGPALVALCTDAVTREPRTLHRTWIRADGKKAEVEPPRMFLKDHRKAGTVIRLWPDEYVSAALGLAEGIETALCAAHGFTPMWSALDAGNLEQFPVLPGIESLTIFADNDENNRGIEAATTLVSRWRHAEVSIVMPETKGHDMADEVAA